jgi:hypothetical protein
MKSAECYIWFYAKERLLKEEKKGDSKSIKESSLKLCVWTAEFYVGMTLKISNQTSFEKKI